MEQEKPSQLEAVQPGWYFEHLKCEGEFGLILVGERLILSG